MPFERWDGRSSKAQQNFRRSQLLRKIRWPALALLSTLSAFSLYEISILNRQLRTSPQSQSIGWQSFSPAFIVGTSADKASSSSSGGAAFNASKGVQDQNNGNWWDDDTLEGGLGGDEGYDTTAEGGGSDVWDPFILNTRPITEVTAKSCMWPPSAWDTCMPDSTPREDAERGKWIRIEKDLNLRIGVYYLYLFYRRLPLYSDGDTVRDFKLLTKTEQQTSNLTLASDGGDWHKISTSLRDGVWPTQEAIYLYYRTAPRRSGKRDDEVNEIDVVWGSSGTLYGWQRMGRDFAEAKAKKDSLGDLDEGAELMWRKGSPQAPKAQLPLSFSADGKYKIMQIADLHFSVAKGQCRDSDWEGCFDARGSDNVTLDWLGAVLDEEKPDLVILSGDQLNGQDTSYSAESVLLKVAKLFESRTIPWAAVLGNHDSEKTTLTRYGQLIMMQALPYFVGEPGPIDVDGEGNYVLRIYSADESRTHIFTLYLLDSHAQAKSWNPLNKDYDYLKQSQIDWFKEESAQIKKIQRPYTPPTLANDTFGLVNDLEYGSARRRSRNRLGKRQEAVVLPSLKKPNAMAIFHIPLPEFYEQPDMLSNGEIAMYGQAEPSGASKTNGHFFEKAILSQTEIGGADSVDVAAVDDDPEYAAMVLNAAPEVKVMMHGHCHVTDQCRRQKGVWMCFPGGSSYSGYSEVGFDRRVRVYEISDYGETISTYKVIDSHAPSLNATSPSTSSVDSALEDTKSQANTSGDIPSDTISEFQNEMAAAIEELEEAVGMGNERAKRQVTEHKRIDEMILVGKGAVPRL